MVIELQNKNNNLAAAAAIVMSSVIVSRITGFIREMLIPAKFGVEKISDAYYIAFQIPDLMFTLLVGGSISAALVPVLSGYIEKNEEEEGWKAASNFINFVTVCMIIGSILGIIFAPNLLSILSPSYSQNRPEMVPVTVNMMRVLFPSVTFIMLAGMCTGILNSYKRFASSAYGPSVYNVLCALSILLLSNSNKDDYYGVYKVAYGIMASALLYFLFQLSFTLKYIHNYRLTLDIKEEGFKKLFRLAVPSLISSSIMQINIIISVGFTSLMPAGQVTALRMADRTWQMPLGVIAQAVGVAILPTLAGMLATGQLLEYKSTLMKSLKSVLVLSMPCSISFIVLSNLIVRTLFQFSGKVDNESVALTASILSIFSIALITQSISTILNRGFYAANDTKTPLFIGASTILANIALSYLFFKTTSLGARGMAVSYAIASIINAFLLIIVLDKKMQGLDLKKFLIFFVKLMACCAVMAFALLLSKVIFPPTFAGSGYDFKTKILQLAVLGMQNTIGFAAFAGCALFLKVEEAQIMIRKLAFFRKN